MNGAELDRRYPPKIANALRAAGAALERLDELVPELERQRNVVHELEQIAAQMQSILRIITSDGGPYQ